ncbi:hypothetical protein GCM10009840_14710 [Pseudolysinimonas kribbensis]|uniref:glycerophosphoryl diester phosphodiesterase membrane domain-containing protein n=1 Tax=Pseudolysinimonas kribbensis TaxID=433641 RepID=UPI0031DFC922
MTDDRQWEPPGRLREPARSAAAPAPLLAPPGPPALGWTPPPRPGLVPLRPLTLGAVIGGAFGILRRNALAVYGPALLVSLAVAVVQALGTLSLLSTVFAVGSDDTASAGALFDGLGSAVVGFAGGSVLNLAATQLVLAVVSLAVAGATVGERRRGGAIWRRTTGRRGAVLGWALLIAAATVVAVGGVTGVIIGIGVAGGGVGAAVAVLLTVLAIPGGLVLWFWLTTRLAFVPATLVVERLRMRSAVTRAWRLTRGGFWRVLGIRLLVSVMVGFAQGLLMLPLNLLIQFAIPLLLPNGLTEESERTALIVTTLVSQLVGAFITAVGVVLTTATTALLYVDLRMRREGLDLELARYVEHPPGSRAGLPDPFRRPERA